MQSGMLSAEIFSRKFSFAQVIQYLAMLCSARTNYVIRTQEGLISGIPKGFKKITISFYRCLLLFFGVMLFSLSQTSRAHGSSCSMCQSVLVLIFRWFFTKEILGTGSRELDWSLEDGRPRLLGKSLDPA